MSDKKESIKDDKGYDIMPNSIKLFENKKKDKDSHPDYTGKMYDENGKEYFVSCWTKETKAGDTYLSGNITDAAEARAKWEKNKRGADKLEESKKTVTKSGNEKVDEDLPF